MASWERALRDMDISKFENSADAERLKSQRDEAEARRIASQQRSEQSQQSGGNYETRRESPKRSRPSYITSSSPPRFSSGPSYAVYVGPPPPHQVFCRRLCIWLILPAALITLIVFLVLLPLNPVDCNVGDPILVKSFNIDSMNTSLHANMVYNLTAHNRNNKIVVKYDGITVDTFLRFGVFGIFSDTGNDLLINSTTSTAAFELGHQGNTSILLEFKVDNLTFSQSVMTQLADQVKNNVSFSVRIRVHAHVRMKFGSLTSPTVFWRPETLCDGSIPPTSHPFTSPLSAWYCQ